MLPRTGHASKLVNFSSSIFSESTAAIGIASTVTQQLTQDHRSMLKVDTLSQPPNAVRGRGRSSSILKVEQVGDKTNEELLDRSVYTNPNAEWVNAKGAWIIHVFLIIAGKVIIDTIPGMSQQISWTLVNLVYLALSYLMFHWVTGIPFGNEFHSGAYDDLTLWEQIDDGAQYTPAKKWLFVFPIGLFLASTHYTNYNPWLFGINLTALILALIPKLPQLHRQRVRFLPQEYNSEIPTPITPTAPNTPDYDPKNISEAHFRR